MGLKAVLAKLKPPSKKGRRLWKVLLGAAVLAGAGGFGFKHYNKKKPVPPEAADSLVAVERGDLERRFEELGDLAPKDRVNVASKVSGRIIELFVQEGDRVKAGQKMAVVQPGRTGAERYLPSTVEAPIEGILMCYIKNPDARNTNARFVEVGDYVTGLFQSQNPTYLMTVADLRKLIVRLKISEMDIFKLTEDKPVEVTVDALPDEEFPGVVSLISPQAERDSNGLKVFRVEVELKKNDKRLRPGMTARVDSLLEKKEDVLKLPLSGVFEQGPVMVAYLHVPEGKPKRIEIETGLRTETEIEIVSGLKEGDRVHKEKPKDVDGGKPAVKGPRGKRGAKRTKGRNGAKRRRKAGRAARRETKKTRRILRKATR